jgi:hypothetical protein
MTWPGSVVHPEPSAKGGLSKRPLQRCNLLSCNRDRVTGRWICVWPASARGGGAPVCRDANPAGLGGRVGHGRRCRRRLRRDVGRTERGAEEQQYGAEDHQNCEQRARTFLVRHRQRAGHGGDLPVRSGSRGGRCGSCGSRGGRPDRDRGAHDNAGPANVRPGRVGSRGQRSRGCTPRAAMTLRRAGRRALAPVHRRPDPVHRILDG